MDLGIDEPSASVMTRIIIGISISTITIVLEPAMCVIYIMLTASQWFNDCD